MSSPQTIPFPRDESGKPVAAEIFLQPIAAPSVLGLYGFAGATFIVAARMAHWFGGPLSDDYLAAFAALFGGVAQFSAGMWAFKARDAVATAMHGMWGSFWIAWGLLELSFMTKIIPKPAGAFQALGFWFIVLAAITWMGMAAALAENRPLAVVLGLLAAGSTIAAVGNLIGTEWISILAGYFFIGSAIVAWYTASAMMLESAFHHPVMPVGKTARAKHAPNLMPGKGEPGVIRGQ
jgi:succinate-acetate transporter protein